MTSPSATADVLAAPSEASDDNYLTHEKGLLSWLLTLDHKRIGLLYMVGVLTAFFVGGVFAMLLRTELLTPGPSFNANSPAKPPMPPSTLGPWVASTAARIIDTAASPASTSTPAWA